MNSIGQKRLRDSTSDARNVSRSSKSDDSCSNTSVDIPDLTFSTPFSKNGTDTTSASSITEDTESEEASLSESEELFVFTTEDTPRKYEYETSSGTAESNTDKSVIAEEKVDNEDSMDGKSADKTNEDKLQQQRLKSDKSTSGINAPNELEFDQLPSPSKPKSAAIKQTSTNQACQIKSKLTTILSDHLPAETLSHKSSQVQDQKQYNFAEDPTMPGVEAIHCPKGIMHDLAEPTFDVWRLDRDSMVDHIEYMYHDLGVVRAWKIPRTTLRMFLLGVRERYQDNPYHNFKHCFCVTQMAYSILCKLRLNRLISVDHMGALLTAAVCHDVDHPGLNNVYHSHARTPLAILYNYKSILEQHHFAVTCRILSNKERNIFRNVNNRDEVLTNVGDLILATDLARHKGIMEDYSTYLDVGFDFKNSAHVMGLLKMIIKCADVSNEVRPETVAGPWVERLFAEYYQQSAREKRECLPVTSYMDPDMVNVSESQEGFIRGMMLPMYDELSKLMVEARDVYVNPLCESLVRYEIQNLRAREV